MGKDQSKLKTTEDLQEGPIQTLPDTKEIKQSPIPAKPQQQTA